MPDNDDAKFEALLNFLKDSRGFDFTGYKRTSLRRRVDRRMQQVGIAGYDEYVDHLQLHTEEFSALFNTILINMTGFFRDLDAWTHLASDALPDLLSSRKPNEPIRVWSAGCASGEEAYTMAMVLAELLGTDEFRDRVKVYATDIDEEALTQARHASYPEADVRDVPEEYRNKYFEAQNGRYVFRSDLRRCVIFGRNDLVQDAPISRVDILLCRNTLMYFNAETQARVLGRLHFALADDGILFLGKAEMLLSHGDRFAPIDLKRRFFRKVRAPVAGGFANLAGFNGVGYEQPNVAEVDELRFEALRGSPMATVVVASNGQLSLANQAAEAMFGLVRRDIGRPFQDLEMSYRPIELRGWIEQAMRDRRAQWIREVEWPRSATETVYLDIELCPISSAGDDQIGVALYFSDVSRHRKLQTEVEQANRQLESAYEELQSTVEELETTNEELQSTVEELETTNEELQSTNEELETMNEELQSTNDELQAINDELRERTQEVNDVNEFFESVLAGLRAGIVVVDRELSVQVWNSWNEDVWGVRRDEAIGRNLLSLDIGLPVDRVRTLARSTLANRNGDNELRVEALNRRGRSVKVRVRAAPIGRSVEQPLGVLLMMETE